MKLSKLRITLAIMCIVAAIAILCISLFAGCVKTVQSEADMDEPSMFVSLEVAGVWQVVYHRETKVMYAVSRGGYNTGTFTVLLNPDGTPMIYGEDGS